MTDSYEKLSKLLNFQKLKHHLVSLRNPYIRS